MPGTPQYGGAGFLPASRGPFEVGGDPGRPDFAVQHLAPRRARADALRLLETLDALDGEARSALEADRDRFLAQARACPQREQPRRRTPARLCTICSGRTAPPGRAKLRP